MKAIIRMLLVVTLAGTLVLIPFTPASAEVPVAYQVQPGDTLQRIAVAHQVTLKALMEANPEIRKPKVITPGQWLRLPGNAVLPRQSFIALLASGQFEIDEILKEIQVHAVYRIVGREFTLGKWGQKSVIVAVAGGGLNNAAIGTSVLLTHFNVSVVGFVGIAGGGHDTLIGDACVASGAVQNDQGNWFDFEFPGGVIAPGLTWYMGGQPVIRDSGTTSELVLFPDAAMFTQIQASLASIELPLVGPEVADFLGVPQYHPSILTDCWSASGNQFVTSERTLLLLDQRIGLAANQLGVTAPRYNIVDEEDFGAIQTAAEYGVPWFIVRVSVDLARQWDPARGVPYDLINDPDAIWGWFFANGASYGNFDWNYFYRQIEIVVDPIVAALPQ